MTPHTLIYNIPYTLLQHPTHSFITQHTPQTPNDPGHFGLALEYYTHFTSPIRRYADIIVHRQLLSALYALRNGSIGLCIFNPNYLNEGNVIADYLDRSSSGNNAISLHHTHSLSLGDQVQTVIITVNHITSS